MIYNLPDRVYRDIIRLAQKHKINRLILFGSRARGTHTERSAIDLAVARGHFDNFYWGIKETVHSLLLFDLVNLDTVITQDLAKDLQD